MLVPNSRTTKRIGGEDMNARQRDKYCDYIDCSHRVYNKEIIVDNPFYEQTEDYCKLHIYGLDDSNYEECRCYNCKHFTLSRRNMKKARERKAVIKAMGKSPTPINCDNIEHDILTIL